MKVLGSYRMKNGFIIDGPRISYLLGSSFAESHG